MKESNDMKDLNGLKRGDIVALNVNRAPLSGVRFNAGDKFKFLGWYGGVGNLVRLSRVGDNAKLMVLPGDIGYGFPPSVAAPSAPVMREPSKLDAPHEDESGPSRRIVIASVLAGKHSGELAMHMTPAEEKEYNAGMARLAELFG